MNGNQENAKKKNMSIKLAAGGGGIILLGGALALVTTFAFRRKRQSNSDKNKHKDSSNKSAVKADHDFLLGQGLSFLVPDSLNHHSPRNGTKDTQDEVSTQILLDENSETNDGNAEEIDILEKERNNYFCDEFSINIEELPVPVTDSLMLQKLEDLNKNNDSLEEVEVMKVNKESVTTECNQVGNPCNDCQVPLRIDGNNQEQVEAAHTNDPLGLDGKAHEQESDGNGKTITERKEILVEGAHSNQPGTDDDSYKLQDECDEKGENIFKKRKEPVKAAARDQTRLNQMPDMEGEKCGDDSGIFIDKGEELIGEVVPENGNLSEELEATVMYGDQVVLCSDGTVLIANENETCNLKKPELLLPLIESSSVNKPGDNVLLEDHLVVNNTEIFKGDEANEPAVEEDHSKVEYSEEPLLAEANGDNNEYYNTYRGNTNEKFEGADEISVLNDQQTQSGDECQNIYINGNQEKYNCVKSLPDINSFQSNGSEVQEFSSPSLDSPSLVKPGKLHKYDSAETTLQTEVINPMEKDGLAEEFFAYQIMLENNPSVQSARNDGIQSYDDGGDSAAAKGEETLKMSFVDITQPTKLSEEVDNKEDEKAVEIIQRENFEVENNLQLPQNDQDYNDNVDTEEYDNNCDDIDVEGDSHDDEDIDNETEEEDNVEEVEESSETIGDSSLDSNAEAIWPDKSVLEFSQEVKELQVHAHNQNYEEIKEENRFVKFNSHKLDDDDRDSFTMAHGKKSEDTKTLEHPTNIFDLKFWFLSLLVPFLLLLWLFLSQLSYFTSFHYHLE